MKGSLDIVVLGLSITSSWGNGHATTYRALIRALHEQGHRVLFLERDVPWYAENRDLPDPPYVRTVLYGGLSDLIDTWSDAVRSADLVIVGSYVPEGTQVGEWVLSTADGLAAFYDIDTPVTLERLRNGRCDYLDPHQIPRYDLYLSFTGGPTLDVLEDEFGSPAARPLYCAVDPSAYYPEAVATTWDLGYMGTYSLDRQPVLERLLLEPAQLVPALRFVVAGPQYPESVRWPGNVERIEHLPPLHHRRFYNAQRLTLNVTRADMVRAGYAPSVRLFEAAACGVAVVSDYWHGLDTFFRPGKEILIADDGADVTRFLTDLPLEEARAMGERARKRVLAAHTAAHRASELLVYAGAVRTRRPLRSSFGVT